LISKAADTAGLVLFFFFIVVWQYIVTFTKVLRKYHS
jgi:hypothetical protein